MEKPKSEPGDPAATKDDHAAPPPCPDRSPTDSGSLGDASSSRATAPQQPSDQHAAGAAAAFDARATPDPDAVWSLVLAKFGRRRRGDIDFAARTFLNRASGVEKAVGDGEAGESAATAAGDALPSSTPPPTRSRVVGSTIGSASLGAASSSRAPAQTSEKHAASNRTFIKPGLLSSPGEDPSLPPPHCHRGITIKGKETANSNVKSAPSSSALLPHCEDGLKEGHPTATVDKDKVLFDFEEQREKVIAKWNRLKSQAWEGQSEIGESLWLDDCIASQRKALEDQEEKLKRVEEEQQQKETIFQQKEWEQKEKKATLQQKENALLLQRMLLRERRIKQEEEEEEASRAQRINNPRLPRRNSDVGFMSGAAAAYYADQMVRVLAVSGTNARPDLFLPLLQHGQVPDFPPIPAGSQLPSSTSVPTTTKPKPDDDTWNKRQLGYIFYLGLAVCLRFIVRPLLPDGYDQFLLASCATVWGLVSVGLPLGIFGTSRLEKDLSRHIGRFISLCFSYMVIYAIYLLAVSPRGVPSASEAHLSPSPSPPPTSVLPLDRWKIVFGIIAFLVTVGQVVSWVTVWYLNSITS